MNNYLTKEEFESLHQFVLLGKPESDRGRELIADSIGRLLEVLEPELDEQVKDEWQLLEDIKSISGLKDNPGLLTALKDRNLLEALLVFVSRLFGFYESSSFLHKPVQEMTGYEFLELLKLRR